MTPRHLAVAMLLQLLGTTVVLAQSSEEPPIPEDPAVAAILATKPSTPVECVRAAGILADLHHPELAKGFLKKVLDAQLDPQQLIALSEQIGSPELLTLSSRADLQPEAKKLVDAVTAAVRARIQNPERIAELIRQLQTPETYIPAIKGLQEARSAAIGPLWQVLADPARAAEHAAVRAALLEMGRLTLDPLLAVAEDADAPLKLQAIQLLGAIHHPSATLGLLRWGLSDQADAAVRAAAIGALTQRKGQAPSRSEAVGLLKDAAQSEFDNSRAADAAADGDLHLWRWDPAKRQCLAKGAKPDEVALANAARWARDAYAIAPDDPAVRRIYLATLLETAARQNGLDRPLDENHPAVVEAGKFGVSTLEDVLKDAGAHGHYGAAAAAARLLGHIGKASQLLYQGAEPSPLAQAMQSPDRRLKLAALESIVRLQPTTPFPGASYVPQTLAFLGGSKGFRRALVACPNLEELRDLSGRLSAEGFQVDAFTNGRDLLLQAARSPDYELALIDFTIDRPAAPLLLQQLRHDSRTAPLRVGLIARSGYEARAERLAERDSLTKAFSRPHDDQAFRWQLGQLAALAPREFVGFEARQRQAARSLDLLEQLCRSSEKLYDVRAVQEAVLAALSNPTLAGKAVAVLARLNSAEAQRALVDTASRLAMPLELRKAACRAFRENVQKHGVLLTSEEIRQQYRRYNESKEQDADSRHILSLILDCLEVAVPPKAE